jgi:hypothetical protein
VELTSIAYDIYRKFEVWLKKKGLMGLADADDAYSGGTRAPIPTTPGHQFRWHMGARLPAHLGT